MGCTTQILVSVAEHHANMVPWQMAAKRTGAVLKHVPLTKDTQEIDMQVCSQPMALAMRTLLSLFAQN